MIGSNMINSKPLRRIRALARSVYTSPAPPTRSWCSAALSQAARPVLGWQPRGAGCIHHWRSSVRRDQSSGSARGDCGESEERTEQGAVVAAASCGSLCVGLCTTLEQYVANATLIQYVNTRKILPSTNSPRLEKYVADPCSVLRECAQLYE